MIEVQSLSSVENSQFTLELLSGKEIVSIKAHDGDHVVLQWCYQGEKSEAELSVCSDF